MQDLTSLNILYSEHRQGILDRKNFEEKMFKVILGNIQNFRLFDGDEEESVDFLCWLYPRLSRAVKNYKDSGAAFSTYIGALIRYSVKEYRSRQVDRYITEYAAWTAHAADFEVRSSAPEYPETGEDETLPLQPAPLALLKSRQILLLILKSYYFISEDFIDRIAPFTGVEKEKLKRMIEKLRECRSRREEEIRLFQERITTQFYRCITWEKRLKTLIPGSARHLKVQLQLERARARLTRMRKRITMFRVEATHRQIADVVGISPGTVSSSLFNLKSHWGFDKKGRLIKKDGGVADGDDSADDN
jgi:hypothetical protein